MRKKNKRAKRRKLQVEVREYSPEGLHYTSEAWRRTLDPSRRLLAFVCLHSVFTLDHVVRYLCGGNVESRFKVRQASELLDRHTGQHQWFFNLDFEFSTTAGGVLKVYYLTQHAVAELRKIAPILARCASPGRPGSVNYERIPHDVDTVESHLRILRTSKVHQFLNEKELKRRLSKAYHARRARGENVKMSWATGDFQVIFTPQNDTEKLTRLCEIATENMKASQIKDKPDGMVWFTHNLHRRDVIAEVKGSKTPIILLDDPLSCHKRLLKILPELTQTSVQSTAKETPVPATSAPAPRLTPREKRVMHAIEQLGGAATTDAIATFLGVKRAGISSCVNRLARENVLRSEAACLCAEHDLGTPTLLYMQAKDNLMSENARRHALIISLIFVRFIRAGFRFCSFDRANGVLEMNHPTELLLPRQAIIADHEEVDLEILRVRILRARGGIRDNKEVIVAMTDHSRMRKLRERNLQVKIVDVSRESRNDRNARDKAA